MTTYNQTKIICTLGPASDTYEKVKALTLAGMDVMRMNFSHGTHEDHLSKMEILKRVKDELGSHVRSLLDTKGPEIRTHFFKDGQAEVLEGSTVTVHMNEIEGNSNEFSISYDKLYLDMVPGECILVDDGYLELTVKKINREKKTITTIAKNKHTLKNRKGINVPGMTLNLTVISSKN